MHFLEHFCSFRFCGAIYSSVRYLVSIPFSADPLAGRLVLSAGASGLAFSEPLVELCTMCGKSPSVRLAFLDSAKLKFLQ